MYSFKFCVHVFSNLTLCTKMQFSPVADLQRHSTGTNFYGSNGMQSASATDRHVEKCAARARRIKQGMEQASMICSDAVCGSGGTPESFACSCMAYFNRLCKKTSVFSKGGVTSRVVLQFGLACAYMHREGFSVGDVVLFQQLDDFARHLPKTYALTKAGHKVRSITRIQDSIRRLVRDLSDNPKGETLSDFQFPDFM